MSLGPFDEEKHHLDFSSIKILVKENDYWKRRSNAAYFITKQKDKAHFLNKINKCPMISSIWETILSFMEILNLQEKKFLKI